mgnify:CR=1 FL=1
MGKSKDRKNILTLEKNGKNFKIKNIAITIERSEYGGKVMMIKKLKKTQK